MAAVHKISEDFFDESYVLIALRSSLEDYALVYAINGCLKSNFKRTHNDLELSNNIFFPIFEWKDLINDRYWSLIANAGIKAENAEKGSLFDDVPTYSKHYLVPEHKEADYILKLEQEDNDLDEQLINLLMSIPKVITAFTIETTKLKHKNNLIF